MHIGNSRLRPIFGPFLVLFFALAFILLGCGKSSLYKVVRVHDGDTITVLSPNKESLRIRFYGMDAPELKQPWGDRSRNELSKLVFGKEVALDIVSKDRYGRSVAKIYVGGLYVNREMVARGLAWWYTSYDKNDKDFEGLQESARDRKIGLWSEKNPIPPWEWRQKEESIRKKRG
ncbi:MAG TPA: thermonuclease family protein [Candidatus Paceibacterota bacterium]|nr:thermonuclease family protein [Candidatus Paceibacterota bacterium]